MKNKINQLLQSSSKGNVSLGAVLAISIHGATEGNPLIQKAAAFHFDKGIESQHLSIFLLMETGLSKELANASILEDAQEDVCSLCESELIGGSCNTSMFRCEGRFCEEAGELYIEHVMYYDTNH